MSDLGLHCLPISLLWNVRHTGINRLNSNDDRYTSFTLCHKSGSIKVGGGVGGCGGGGEGGICVSVKDYRLLRKESVQIVRLLSFSILLF